MYLTLTNTSLYTTSFGSPQSPPILALSGWIGSWEDWADTFSILSQNWHTISFDHRGSGATIAPLESITLDNLVDDIFAVLDAYNIDRCVLAAMSMGTAVALNAALKHPHRFTGLVIVNGFYQRPAPNDTDPFLLGLQHSYQATLDHFANLCVPEPNSDHIKHWGRQILDRASQQAAIALYSMPLPTLANLHLLAQPSLIIHGDADPLVPLQSSRNLAQILPNAKLSIIPGAGHVPIMTRPHEVAHEITTFFNP